MNILLLGANGQVGRELQRSLAPLGTVTALTRQGHNGISGDLGDPGALAASVKAVNMDAAASADLRLKISAEDIIAVSSGKFPTSAARPGNSRLETDRLENTFNLCMPPWGNGVRRVVKQTAYCQHFNPLSG